MKHILKTSGRPALLFLAILLIWQTACAAFDIPEFLLPSPIQIFAVGWEYRGLIFDHAMQTLFTTVLGFIIAMVVGGLLGIIIGSSRAVYDAAYPVLIAFNAIPKVAIVPLIIIWTGIGTMPAVITAFMISFFPIVVNVATGLASVEPELEDVLRVLGATRTEVLRKVSIRRALPFFFASVKIAVTLAFIGSVVSETIGSNNGIGYLILSASSRFQISLVYASVFAIAAMSVGMYFLCVLAERRFVGWAYRGQK